MKHPASPISHIEILPYGLRWEINFRCHCMKAVCSKLNFCYQIFPTSSKPAAIIVDGRTIRGMEKPVDEPTTLQTNQLGARQSHLRAMPLVLCRSDGGNPLVFRRSLPAASVSIGPALRGNQLSAASHPAEMHRLLQRRGCQCRTLRFQDLSAVGFSTRHHRSRSFRQTDRLRPRHAAQGCLEPSRGWMMPLGNRFQMPRCCSFACLCRTW